jgi:uncharacterized protein YggE
MRRVILALLLTIAPGGAAAQEPSTPTPSIVTIGEAIVRRAPDQAFVQVAVETRARNPRDAQRQNAQAMTAVQQRLAAEGLPKDALRTVGYTIQQEFDFVGGRQVLRGYVARNGVEVRVDSVDRAGDVVDAAVQAGATNVGAMRFELKDRAGAEREALRLAVIDARQRAEAAALGIGRGIDRVIRVEENRQLMQPPRPMMQMAREAAADLSTPIEAGEIEIRAQITLTVAIK